MKLWTHPSMEPLLDILLAITKLLRRPRPTTFAERMEEFLAKEHGPFQDLVRAPLPSIVSVPLLLYDGCVLERNKNAFVDCYHSDSRMAIIFYFICRLVSYYCTITRSVMMCVTLISQRARFATTIVVSRFYSYICYHTLPYSPYSSWYEYIRHIVELRPTWHHLDSEIHTPTTTILQHGTIGVLVWHHTMLYQPLFIIKENRGYYRVMILYFLLNSSNKQYNALA